MSIRKTSTPEIIGIDLGNTLIRRREVMPHAFRVVRRLIEERFGENTHIVSRVSPEQEIRARAFVTGSEFQSNLGIPIERVHFCRERHEKGPICHRIGITHFIDDRPEVMVHMPTIVTHRILFNPNPDDLAKVKDQLGAILQVKDWLEVESFLL